MTSSETPTDGAGDEPDDVEAPRPRSAGGLPPAPPPVGYVPWDRDQWIRFGVIAGSIVVGWLFILSTHSFRLGPAVVFLGLGWLAVVAGVHNLWKTGTATTDPVDEEAAWWRPAGARDELEREKRSLLKAIKEVEFDHQTGKMSKPDADAITRVYRARAIEVIKALDEIDERGGKTAREQIEREVLARVAIDIQAKKGEDEAKELKERREKKLAAIPGAKGSAKAKAKAKASTGAAAKPQTKPESNAAKPDAKPESEAQKPAEPNTAKPEAAPEPEAGKSAEAAPAPESAAPAAAVAAGETDAPSDAARDAVPDVPTAAETKKPAADAASEAS
jgi:hypothetical protein